MRSRLTAPATTLLAAAALLVGAGCAPPIERVPRPLEPRLDSVPAPTPLPVPAATPAEQPRSGEIAARKQRALELQNGEELAAALIHWRILRTLAPDDPEIQRQTAATQALIRHRVEERLAAGAAAAQAGDTAGSRDTYLRALALDPSNGEALARLRRLETAAVYAVQKARLDKIRARRAQALARKTAGKTAHPLLPRAENGNGQERDYRDMGIALFEAGDYEASILELRKYLGSFPDDDAALEVLRKAEQGAREGSTRATAPGHRTPPLAATSSRGNPRSVAAPAAEPPAALPAPSLGGTAADKKTAQDLYEQGVRLYRQDISGAIRLWEQSLALDPDHVKARLHLDQAHKMQRRLETIDRQ
jgi:tetratricopeptide (TPR) repeat protein